ncbi:hypothetical protein ACFVGY_15910 [Streptomyces sp. NPDC127106]|uniref:hypothetical protein n=1 Tax=Streptomyces sp. NPDC127106 TaxID=3345360 RepID=UPI003632DDF5
MGDFDQDVLAPLAAACEAAAGDGEVAKAVMDVSEVGFADSASLNELLRLPELTGALGVFPVADRVDAARAR